MTHIAARNIATSLSTPMHLARSKTRVKRLPAYGTSFGLAAMLLSIVGVESTYEVTQDTSTAESALLVGDTGAGYAAPAAPHEAGAGPRASSPGEWDEWKPLRDLA